MIAATPAAGEGPIVLTLPDGNTREVAPGTLARDVVGSIGARLLQAALAVAVDGEVQDLMTPLRRSGAFVVITDKDPRALGVLRHSGAHILATAVRRLRPDAKIGFGPAIDDGFYYDFEVESPFTPEDLAAFEAEMRKVVAEKYPFVRAEVSVDEAKQLFADDPLKLERLADFDGTDEIISTYTDGPFIDLCRGPHVPDTSYLKHFKLLHTAGAYWRGDVKRQMLQRIYATAFFKKDELETHLHNLEEAKKRDHRVLGKALGLFQLFPQAPGAAFWTPKGTTLYNTLEGFVRERQQEAFQEIKTPLLYNKKLWEQSGHWGKYKENMFLVLDNETGEHDMSLKPMNCPSHHVLFASHKHSYRELPVRYVTFDVLHRNELSGALSGLTRVRQFSQDDCHVYLREDQIESEVKFLMDFILSYYDTFGLTATLKFATRPEQRIGSDELWDRAEAALRAALDGTGRPYEMKEGDGAFYGPKIDFDVTDSIGRAWQLGTIQLDYNAPERFDLSYTGEDNAPHRPVVIHRAVSGSFERFIAILIEHFGGAFPLWLAPEQVRVIPIAIDYNDHAQQLVARMKAHGIRATLDARNETLNYRVREGEVEKVPYMCVLGRREAEEHTVALRARGAGKKQEILSQDAFVARVLEEIRTRALAVAAAPAADTGASGEGEA
ncbi:MAG: threonine--tRNA ligase [Gemmatimonas sp.]|uniref:threonine--tRNA ligase n=1 Tax=Gemmatimonas sp. TaxID=1962908 RepID=UPI0025BBCEDD|nr:threonine--tRNA ligase [Gemmatimonas sp.]MCA2984911.1 threonine--tRNA ligase [Gemmatimonas sp.]MCA2988520.1 threonine--tRNA ligase [Gemmatimonas sp.]MCA2994604.1 threonine--tRNA ligase [Gemmatimonas sp.]